MLTNYDVIKNFLKYIVNKTDIVICMGKSISTITSNLDREGVFYLDIKNANLFFSIGVTKYYKGKVFLMADSETILTNFSKFVYLNGVDQKNLFIYVFNNKSVKSKYNGLSHAQAVYFNMGFKSFVADSHFGNVADVKKFKEFIKNIPGPSVISINYEKDISDKYEHKCTDIEKMLSDFRKCLDSIKEG